MFSNTKAKPCDSDLQLTNGIDNANRRNMGRRLSVLFGLAYLIGGCVQVAAPDKPIVINLNIGISGEVQFKLNAASKKLIEENQEIF